MGMPGLSSPLRFLVFEEVLGLRTAADGDPERRKEGVVLDEIRVIPTRMHGVLDYLVGILLIASPWVFGFNDSNSAQWTAIIVGGVLLVTSLMTNYEVGMVRAIPMRMHLMADAVVGVFLVIAPWLLGFGDEGTNAWLPFVAIGVAEIGTALMTETVPRRRDLAKRERELAAG